MKSYIASVFFTLAVLGGLSACRSDSRSSAPVDVDYLIELMGNLGGVETRSISENSRPGERDIVIKAQRATLYITLAERETVLRSIYRSVQDGPDESLMWTKQQAMEKAISYRRLFLNEDNFPAPDYVLKSRLSGGRKIWSVSWMRRIKGYIVMPDFITINFNEVDGLYGLTRHWETPEDIKIPDQVVDEEAAKKAAKEYGLRHVAYNSNRFAGFLLGEVGGVGKILVAPNAEFNGERFIWLGKSAPMNLRPAWAITFVNI